METTIISLAPNTDSSNMVVRTIASFEEAFGDFSNAKGKGRAKRKARKLSRITDRQEVKQARKGGRQEARISRRATRKGARQEMRDTQQASRMERRGNRRDERQESREAKQLRKDTDSIGEQERENYNQEQENYRDSLAPQEEEDTTNQGGSDYQEEDGGSDYQDGGGSNDWDSDSQGYDEGDADEGDGAYGDDNRYDSPYVQEDTEFADDSYFNVEGMEGKSVVSPMVKDNVAKLRNNQRAYKDLNDRRNLMLRNGDNTRGIDMQIRNCYGRVNELKSSLDSYANADGNPETRTRRRKELNMALGRGKKRRTRTRSGGSEVPVSKELNPEFAPNRIEIPAKSGFDGYSDLGRPVYIDGVENSDANDYSSDLYTDGIEPTTIDLYSNADGSTKSNKKVILSIAIGIGVGVLAIYIAKKKGLI